jgi:hypothetical protein
MAQKTRLTDDEFKALRSVARDPWASGAGFQWKHNGVWLEVEEDGWSRRAGTDEAYRWRGALVQRGLAARDLLLDKGLVQEEEVPCCKGQCGHVAWVLTTLTPRGVALMAVLSREAAQVRAARAAPPA